MGGAAIHISAHAHTAHRLHRAEHKGERLVEDRAQIDGARLPRVGWRRLLGRFSLDADAGPLGDAAVFRRAIDRPIALGDMTGISRLRVLLKAVCLRRTKSILAKQLPQKTVAIHKVKLSEAQRAYAALDAVAVLLIHEKLRSVDDAIEKLRRIPPR